MKVVMQKWYKYEKMVIYEKIKCFIKAVIYLMKTFSVVMKERVELPIYH